MPPPPPPGGPPPHIGDRALAALALLLSVPAGIALGLVLYRFPPPLALAVVGGAGLVGVLMLALARTHAAVALGFALLGVVLVDPAPSDGVFVVVMAVTLLGRRVAMGDVPRSIPIILAVYAALSVMSALQVTDPVRAAVFFGTTVYLALFSLWLPGYVVSENRARLVVRAYLFAAAASAVLGVLAVLGAVPRAAGLRENGAARAQGAAARRAARRRALLLLPRRVAERGGRARSDGRLPRAAGRRPASARAGRRGRGGRPGDPRRRRPHRAL